MKECKDCLHYDICLGAFGDWLPKTCGSFKDKSKFLELPCPIGRDVYKIVTENVDVDGYGMWWEKETFVKKLPFRLDMFYQFGKTVFLTREEAEKKLEEMKNENT